MKKLTILALCFIMAVGFLTACSGCSSADETAVPSTGTETAPSSEPATTRAPETTAPTTEPSTTMPAEKGIIDGNGDAASDSGRVNRSH